ncbi:chromate efflux transporter [Corallococcus sp. 4LFB]|uniref:chromate efflux transporter n=1 Tax=Corallococcus sp. 4LFB TaxID=3383249 RepID=UPI00397721AC
MRRRTWLSREEFLDLLGATNLIPGPNSTELAIHLGHRRAGWPGLVVAGVCFIVPAMLLTLAAAWAYVRFGTLPQAGALLYGVKPVILAVVLQALWGLGKTALTTRPRIAVAVGAAVASALGTNELLILAVAGAALAAWLHVRSAPAPRSMLAFAPFALHGATAVTASVPFSLGGLFLFFLKVGSVLFGSGYVLLAFLRADLVEHWGWLTEAQLLDAVAVGQFTPGPVFTTATFIGYLVGGTPGAGLATLGIFLPAFVFVALSGPLIPRLRRSQTAGAVLDGVNAASLALMAVVTWQLGRAALVDAWTVALAVIGAVLLLRWRVNSAWLVLGGAAVGLLLAL